MDGKRKKPAVRFAGFTGDWEQRKLSELGQIMTGSTPSTSKSEYYSEDGIPWVTPTDIESTTISNTPRRLSKEGAKVGRVVPANTILCTCIASIGKNTLLTVKGSFNQQINSLTPYDENDAYFLLTESELWSDKMKRMAASGTMQIVNKTVFSELQTMVPKKAEQQQIGEYFKNLDHLITLHQRKYDALVNTKKSMLQKMFPQNGETVPEIRFSGFTGDWERRKFGDLCENITVGIANSATHAYCDKGVVMFRNQNIKENMLDDSDIIYIDKEFEEKYKNKRLKENDLLVARTGYPGTACVVPKKYENTQTFTTLIARPKNCLNSFFASQYMNSDIGKSYFSSTQIGGGQKNSGAGILENLPMMLPPTLVEQIKIADYCSNLDNLITLQQHKLEKLKQLKQSMLEKMFV